MITRRAVIRSTLLVRLCALGLSCMISMPGESYHGELPQLSSSETALAAELERYVTELTEGIGERNLSHPGSLEAAAALIEAGFRRAGYEVERHGYAIGEESVHNLIAELKGTGVPDGDGNSNEEILVVGGHYDSAYGTVGANDNGTGAAATLVLAERLAGHRLKRTLRFVAFVNEEPPYFQTEAMGSLVYAKRCSEHDDPIVGMISLETMGFYDDSDGSQQYPFPFSLFYPSRGNFIGFVGNAGSRRWVRRVIGSFRSHAQFPSEGAAIVDMIPGVGWSDHWSFYEQGYPALMVTDTAPFRYPHYHEATDTVDKIDFERLARVVHGLEKVLLELADADSL